MREKLIIPCKWLMLKSKSKLHLKLLGSAKLNKKNQNKTTYS